MHIIWLRFAVFMDSNIIRQDSSLAHSFVSRDFDIAYWTRQSLTRCLAGGRGASYLINMDDGHFVLRHYLRGGMMARLLQDRYLWTGLDRCRPMLEWQIVKHARGHDLPVPEVAAVRVERHGIWYRAAIISRYIENRGTLASMLEQTALEASKWQLLGQVIRAMHQAGIDHADLNANNLLYTIDEKWCLIDFDKAVTRINAQAWAQKNLDRLLRSLHKIQALQQASGKPFHFSDQDWQHLLDGYAR